MPSAPSDLRVAVFCEQGHPHETFTSGVTRFTRNLFRFAEERRLPVDVFTYHGGTPVVERGTVHYHGASLRTRADFHGLEVDPLDTLPLPNHRHLGHARLRAASAPGPGPGHARPYDVVFATAPGIGTQGQILARSLGVPFVMLFTTDLPHYGAELLSAWSRHLDRAPLKRAVHDAAWAYLRWLYDRRRTDLVLVPTEAFRGLLLEHADARAEVLGRGSDTLDFAEGADLAAHPDPPRMIFVGRLDIGQKNLGVLVRAVREIPEASLTLVGGGEDKEKLRGMLDAEVRAGRVDFTGHVSDPARLAALYQSADLFAFPSVFDTLGQVVIEAQKAGLPVVVMNEGGPPELVVDGRSGFVADDADAFVARCRRLVEHRALRVEMGRAAREHALGFPTWDNVMERLYGHFRALAERGRISARGPGPERRRIGG